MLPETMSVSQVPDSSVKKGASRRPGALWFIAGLSCILFLIRLYFCRRLYPDIILTNDFYGYIELGKNVFHDFNFIVRWILDNPVSYPPLFSVFVHLVTLFTKDALYSIQCVNAFAVSFVLIPLYALVKKLLNDFFAFCAVLFTTYYFGVTYSSSIVYSDFFFSAMALTACWLVWDTLTRKDQSATRYILTGVFISLVYLTKFTGILYCLAAAMSIFCFFRQFRSARVGIKMASFCLVGFLPLFLAYQLVLLHHADGRKIDSMATFVFFDGNAEFEKNREQKMYGLNAEGTEFEHLSVCRTHSVFGFCLKHPRLIFKKYIHGLKQYLEYANFSVFPFIKPNIRLYLLLQVILIVLLMTLPYDKWRAGITHVVLFMSPVFFIPLFYGGQRYFMPFVPLYFILWLFAIQALRDLLCSGLSHLHLSPKRWFGATCESRFRRIGRSLGVVVVLAMFLYSIKSDLSLL
jgi:hypothetical protein